MVVYENHPVTPEMGLLKPMESYDGVAFTCASSAKRFMDAMGWQGLCKIYSIGPKTTAFLKANGIGQVLEANQCTYEGLVECICRQ